MWSHLICCILDIKFAGPIPLEINGIDQDKSGQGVKHVWLDQIFDLGLGDLLHPVVDQPSRGFSIAVVSLLKGFWISLKGFYSNSKVNGLNLQFENLNGCMEMLVQSLFVSIEDGKTTLDEDKRLKKKLSQYYIAPGQIWSSPPLV